MEEKTIISGEKEKFSPLFIIPVSLIVISLLMYLLNVGGCRSYTSPDTGVYIVDRYIMTIDRSFFSNLTFLFAHKSFICYFIPIFFYLGIIIGIIILLFIFVYKNVSITVTDKRVYGTAAFGKRVDLPFDSITSIGTSFFNGIAVATPSGKIKFRMIKNRDDIHKEISKLLIERQGSVKTTTTTAAAKQDIPQSNADELKKFKELLDSGVITQEEFDAKKKQLLGL